MADLTVDNLLAWFTEGRPLTPVAEHRVAAAAIDRALFGCRPQALADGEMGAHGIAEGAEQAAEVSSLGPVFRMPLHPDRECRRVAHRHGLDRAVLGDRLDLQARGQAVDTLAMHGIDADVAGAEHASQAGPALDRTVWRMAKRSS